MRFIRGAFIAALNLSNKHYVKHVNQNCLQDTDYSMRFTLSEQIIITVVTTKIYFLRFALKP